MLGEIIVALILLSAGLAVLIAGARADEQLAEFHPPAKPRASASPR